MMRRILAGAALLAAALVGGRVQGEPETNGGASAFRFRVVQWNVGHFALGKDSNTSVTDAKSAERSAEYRAMIASLKPDFLGVSEYDPYFDKVGRLAKNEVFASFPTKVIGPKNIYHCNAVFTHFKCMGSTVVDYNPRKQQSYFMDTVFMFGTNEVHFVQSHLDFYMQDGQRLALKQMPQLVEYFNDKQYVIISADFNVDTIGDFSALAEAGYTIANDGRYKVLDNIAVKGFDVKDVFAADEGHALSDHTIIGCDLEMRIPGGTAGWVDESAATTAFTGKWSVPLAYYRDTRKSVLCDNEFEPYTASGGNVATLDVTASFLALPEERETPETGVQGSLCLGENGSFKLWTRLPQGGDGHAEGGWVDVAAAGVTPTIGVDYTFRFKFDYRFGVYSVAIVDGGTLRPLVATAGAPFAAGTSRFPVAAKQSSISSVGFFGDGLLTSIVGDYCKKDWFMVILR